MDKRFPCPRRGFTLAESLFVLLILSLVTGAMVIGIQYATRQYMRSMILSQAKILCSTLTNAISTELSNGEDFELDYTENSSLGVIKYFKNQNYHGEAREGFAVKEGMIYLNCLPLISPASYPRGLTATLVDPDPITYSAALGAFHVKLSIHAKLDGEDWKVTHTEFDVFPLNPVQTGP